MTPPFPTSRSTPTENPEIRCLVNDVQPGPAQAIRYGIERAAADVVVVTMADGCDDPQQIDQLVRLVERGVVVAAASRYSRGGQQVGGPFLKGLLSRMAGLSLWALARVGTRDATNSFKAYDVGFVRQRRDHLDCRVRDRHRAGGQGPTGPPAGGRAADHLARAPPGRVKLQAGELVAALPALVAVRLRPAPHRGRDPGRRRSERNVNEHRTGHRIGRIHRWLRGQGAARPGPRRGRASTTTPSTARSSGPTTTIPGTDSSRGTPGTST